MDITPIGSDPRVVPRPAEEACRLAAPRRSGSPLKGRRTPASHETHGDHLAMSVSRRRTVPRDLRVIQDELDQARAKKQRCENDLDRLTGVADGEMSQGELIRAKRLMSGLDNANEEVAQLEEEQAAAIHGVRRSDYRENLKELVRSGRAALENGDGAAPSRGPTVISRNNIRNPWGVNGGYPAGGDELIRHAQAAVEQVNEDYDHDIDRARYLSRLEQRSNRKDAELTAQWALASSDPLYRAAFQKMLRYPQHGLSVLDRDEMRAWERAEVVRTALSLTDANGGYLVPFTLDPNVILTNAGIADPIRSISNIKTIATDTWNGVTSAGVTAEWLGEGVQAADATPTFGQPVITPKKAGAWVFGSYEVLADSGFANELSRLLADAKARLEGAAFATGNTGATIPRGVVAAVAAVTASIVTAATTNAFVVGDVYNVSDALRPRDASRATFIANKKIFSLIRRFDTSGGGAFWTNLGMKVPQQLLGQPIYECSTMANAVTTGGNVLLVGNFDEFYVVDRVGMTILYDPIIRSTGNNRPTGQAGYFCFWRVGADAVDPDAFRLLQLNMVAAATALG